jgi:hypothetical protein
MKFFLIFVPIGGMLLGMVLNLAVKSYKILDKTLDESGKRP